MSIKINLVIDAKCNFYLQFIATLVRNIPILIGQFKLNLVIFNCVWKKSRIFKMIARYMGQYKARFMLEQIIQLNIIQDKTQISNTNFDELNQNIKDFINMHTNELNININYGASIMNDSSDMTLYIDILNAIASKRIQIDRKNKLNHNNLAIDIFIDGLTYLPNAKFILSLASKYQCMKFHIVLKSNKYDSDINVLEDVLHNQQNIQIITSVLRDNKEDNEIYLDDLIHSRLYMVETVVAIDHTQLSEDIELNNSSNIAFIFGSEGDGVSSKVRQYIESYSNKQNIIIKSNSPFFHNKADNIVQNYSMNLPSCITTILANF